MHDQSEKRGGSGIFSSCLLIVFTGFTMGISVAGVVCFGWKSLYSVIIALSLITCIAAFIGIYYSVKTLTRETVSEQK